MADVVIEDLCYIIFATRTLIKQSKLGLRVQKIFSFTSAYLDRIEIFMN
jgi:hypothetical protein